MLGSHGQGTGMPALRHFIWEHLGVPTHAPRPMMPCFRLAPPSLPLFFPSPACTSNAAWRSPSCGTGPSGPHEEPDRTLEPAPSCPYPQSLIFDARLQPIFLDPTLDASFKPSSQAPNYLKCPTQNDLLHQAVPLKTKDPGFEFWSCHLRDVC